MDDKEGARELLEEILKEGGPNQQLRAKELLDGLV
jgi:pilus assembly protein FimV